ncbi:MAG: periplasmic heavy metal sensor [Verrucomicrobiae bacterium]|nr:periplasmic heavy metal sensor [Verrucomicrobiae bacterium]
MKIIALALSLTFLACGANALDLDHLVTPETIFAFRDSLAFTPEQESELKQIFEKAKSESNALEDAVKTTEESLNDLLRTQELDSGDAETAFQALLDAEEKLKLLQFRTLLALRAVLDPEQISKARSLGKHSRESNAPLMASIEGKAKRLKMAFDELDIKPAGELVSEGERIRDLIQSGDLEAADESLDALGKKVGIDESPDKATIDFSQQNPGDIAQNSLEVRYRSVESAVQGVTYLPRLRQLLQARDALESAKAAEDAEGVGRVLTWVENLLGITAAP